MPTTQDDLVKMSQGLQSTEVTEKVVVPGVEALHLRKPEEIADVLVNVMKSQANIIKFTYVLGSHFEITRKTT